MQTVHQCENNIINALQLKKKNQQFLFYIIKSVLHDKSI